MAREPLGGAQAAPALIRSPHLNEEDSVFDFRQLLPAWIISGVVHVVILSLFLLVAVTGGATTTSNMEQLVTPIMTEEEIKKDVNLTEDDLGTPVRRWRCGSPGDGTDVKHEFLPSSCRGV